MSDPIYMLPLRKVITPKKWSSLSRAKKLFARRLHSESRLAYNMFIDGQKLSIYPPIIEEKLNLGDK